MSSNHIRNMICGFCDEVHAFPEQNDNGIPRTFPVFRPGNRLRLDPDVFANRYPDIPADQNAFVIAGPLADGECRRTIHCAIKFDRARLIHRYQITILWTGCVGNIREQRKISVWADDVSVEKEGK